MQIKRSDPDVKDLIDVGNLNDFRQCENCHIQSQNYLLLHFMVYLANSHLNGLEIY